MTTTTQNDILETSQQSSETENAQAAAQKSGERRRSKKTDREYRMSQTTRNMYVQALVNHQDGSWGASKWWLLIIGGIIICSIVASFTWSSVAILTAIVVIVGCNYGRWQENKRLVQYEQEVQGLTDRELRQTYEDMVAVNGFSQPRKTSPILWGILSSIVALIALSMVNNKGEALSESASTVNSKAMNFFNHRPQVNHTLKIHNQLDSEWEAITISDRKKGDIVSFQKAMNELNQFVMKMDTSKSSREYQNEFVQFKSHVAKVNEMTQNIPDGSSVFEVIQYIVTTYGIEALEIRSKMPPMPEDLTSWEGVVWLAKLAYEVKEAYDSVDKIQQEILTECDASYLRLKTIAVNSKS